MWFNEEINIIIEKLKVLEGYIAATIDTNVNSNNLSSSICSKSKKNYSKEDFLKRRFENNPNDYAEYRKRKSL